MNYERAVLFSVTRDLYPPLPPSYVGKGGKNGNKHAFSKEKRYMWTGRCSKRKKYCSAVKVQSIQINVFTINAYKDVIFMCLFRQLVDFET